MLRKTSILVVCCLIISSVFTVACNRKNPAAQVPESDPTPRAQVTALWVSFADAQLGLASSTDQSLMPTEASMFSSSNSLIGSFHDPLDGSTLGIPNILGYGTGFLGQSAAFGGNHYYIQYGVGSQIGNAIPLEFYLYVSSYQQAYNGWNIIFTQCGFGGASTGDVQLALTFDGSLSYSQWGPGWNYQYSSPLPMNQWVKIRAEFGSTGMNLFINDQLACSDPNRRIPISARPFYFGTRPFYGPEHGFHGSLDEVRSPPGSSLKITQPSDGDLFIVGESVEFQSQAVGNLFNFEWTWDGNVFGTSQNTTTSSIPPGHHTITVTARRSSDNSQVSGSINIEVLSSFKIKNLDAPTGVNPLGGNFAVSYRAVTTRFQAIGYRADGMEAGPVSVRWELAGGDVDVAHEQLRSGVLLYLGQPLTKIGNFSTTEGSPLGSVFPIASAATIRFQSFLPGNIGVNATRGTASDAAAIRIKQPNINVDVHPVGSVDTTIFNTWANVLRAIWEKDNIIKVDGLRLNLPPIPNVTYPNPPLTPPYKGGENDIFSRYLVDPSLISPLVFDCLLGDISGFSKVSRQAEALLNSRTPGWINIFLVSRPYRYFVSNQFASPPTKSLGIAQIYPMSSRDHFLTLEVSAAFIQDFPAPAPAQYNRFLAAGVGRILGLPQYFDWLNNFMDFSPSGGLEIMPIQIISALNYKDDNPQNAIMIVEK